TWITKYTFSFTSNISLPTDEEEELDEPLKFTTSQASHRTWKVDRSMGSHYERPWWKVFPISVAVSGFLLWCALRDETDVDVQLEKQQLPDEQLS
uniref:Uncharacterized protein n=1 Tax=Stegastes partitus TaxID=144197 RepID=A0A3B5AL94_9TELE